MKKKWWKIPVILLVVLIVLELALQVYVVIETKRRAALPGNAAAYDTANLSPNEPSVLTGKTILFLGSSVTYGGGSDGQSFVELFEALDGVKAIKEAKNTTTLVEKFRLAAFLTFGNGKGYVTRLREIDPNTQIDCVVVQLSTNDASTGQPLGEIAAGRALSDFDTKTISGAMEYIIAYCQETWHCPVVFYSGAYFEDENYPAMVGRMYELQEKWGIGIIDLYTDEAFNDISPEQYAFYMFDPIHPTKAGYLEWWMPRMEADLIAILAN